MPSISSILQETYQLNFSEVSSLECGAYNGEESKDFPNQENCHFIEAQPSSYEHLKNIKNNSFHYALSDYCGEVSFTITSWNGNSSIQHSEDHIEELKSYGSSFDIIKVPCITYFYFINEVIKKPIDILILDVEGHESSILETFKELKNEDLPKIIVIECGYDWEKRKELLIELGYEIDFYEFNNCYVSLNISEENKNKLNMNKYNQANKEFIWNNKLIFKNEKI